MIIKNSENILEYNISMPKSRDRGISAMLRVGDEEEFIEACIDSILPFFDEVVVVLNSPRDNTEEIVKSIDSDKIKIYHYPFKLFPNGAGHKQYDESSVKEVSYYYNWCLSKTTKTHVCKWDGDMIALPNLMNIRKKVFANDLGIFLGINIVKDSLSHVSKSNPKTGFEARFFKVKDHTYYIQGDKGNLFSHKYGDKSRIFTIKDPLFLHYKHVKDISSATKIWPDNWRESKHFVDIMNRCLPGNSYKGEHPEAIYKKVLSKAFSKAEEVEPLKSQRIVMQSIYEILKLKKMGEMSGDILEIGAKLGKTSVFMSVLASFMFPENTLYVIDPFCIEGSKISLRLDDDKEIFSICDNFKKNISNCNNINFIHEISDTGIGNVSDDILFAFIDGEHTYSAVIKDYNNIIGKMKKGGVIGFDDYKNGAWPGVGKAVMEIVKSDKRLKIIREDVKVMYCEVL
jgi:hypothetical protein